MLFLVLLSSEKDQGDTHGDVSLQLDVHGLKKMNTGGLAGDEDDDE